ncbi:MAG: MFS transporter [Alphaproteobacteria bacterium]|nr:MFS transporter [Alphaproteobacteria bacterium]
MELQNLKYSLFLHRRFLPVFLATFLGAFNDNMLRSGLVVMIAYSASKGITLPARPEILVTICSALLVAPMILFAPLAGALADKFEKSFLVVCTKIAELLIMIGALYGFATQNIPLLMLLLFFSGTHTTFYSPIKFSILPEHLRESELLAGNGFVAGGSYLAVLLGLVAGGLLIEMPDNLIGTSLLVIAVVGLVASLFIPKTTAAHPEAPMHWNLWRGGCAMVAQAWADRPAFHNILALSWFALFSSVYMAQFANFAHGVVKANNEVYILFLSVFSLGIAIGSLLCDTLLKGQISSKLTPLSAFGTALFTYLMVLSIPTPTHEGLLDVVDFIQVPALWPMLLCMLMVAVSGGIYIVPLYALLQSRCQPEYRSRMIAASNLSDAVFMTLAALVSAVMLWAGLSITDLFVMVATLNLGVVWYARKMVS